MPPHPRNRRLAILLALIALDALVTAFFVFRGPAETDTARYALDFYRWMRGEKELAGLFNAEMSFGFYAGLAAWQRLHPVSLAALPDLLNWISWGCGVLATGACYLWWERWWDGRVATRLTLLFIATPAYWSLHLYGNTNIIGLALAAAAVAATPGSDGPAGSAGSARQIGRTILAVSLGIATLCVRTDLILLAPALAAFVLWGRDRPSRRMAIFIFAASLAGYALLRWMAVGSGGAGGTLARHWGSNLSLSDPRWLLGSFLQNSVFLGSAGPPLIFLASVIAFFGVSRARVRPATLLWIAPAALFVFFSRVHLTRILLPQLPGVLLPLAVWATEGGRRRDLALAGIVLSAHLVMGAVPSLMETARRDDSHPPRVNHYFFRGIAVRDHLTIQHTTDELLADARGLVEEIEADSAGIAIVGEDVVCYELYLESRHPGSRVTRVGRRYQVDLQRMDIPGHGAPVYLLMPRWGEDPSIALREFGVPDGVRPRYTRFESRLRGRSP
ncbi:MAG: hypothetical protein KC729_11980 [Candidatus Eisenbacteria bacterium]|uniref:Uncharacterized protein n=1 Tax=Eiseniibacteriota bacterium TaxID=2212470 RepID=A0A956RP93_UNCEI|nr:hypothetical protein [Candidatus Eisenbacteria bacterium]